jgi:hypothetical protein
VPGGLVVGCLSRGLALLSFFINTDLSVDIRMVRMKMKDSFTHVFGWALRLVVFGLILGVPFAAVAEDAIFSGSSKPGAVLNSGNGGVYDVGEYGVILKYLGAQLDDSYSGGDSVATSTPGVTEKSFDQYQVILRTGIYKNIDVRVIIPFLNKDTQRQTGSGDLYSGDSEGIGDAKLIARYSLMAQKRKDPVNLAIGIGLKAPTGATDNEDSSGTAVGYLQTGTGSWDPVFEVGAHRVSGRHWLSSDLMYQMTSEGRRGDSDYEAPDLLKFNLGYAFVVNPYFDVQLELNNEWRSKAELDGVTQDNTGGFISYVTPGAHLKCSSKASFDFGVAVPVYRDLNGSQLSEDYRIIGKMTFKI